MIANVTKVWGSHASKAGFYYQNSFKPQSIFASFNSQIDFTDNTNNPFDTGYSYANAATGVFNSYQQANKYALPEWRYHNFEWYAQDNWKPNKRLTLDYGLRFYYLTPQWDTTLQASNFLPDQFDANNAAKLYTAGLHRRVSVFRRCQARDGSDARRPGDHADGGEHGRGTLHRPADARVELGSTAPTRQARGSTISCRAATPSGCRRG